MATTAKMRLRMPAPQAPIIKRVPPTRCAVPLHTNISAAHPLTNSIQTVIVARALKIGGISPSFLVFYLRPFDHIIAPVVKYIILLLVKYLSLYSFIDNVAAHNYDKPDSDEKEYE